MKVDDLRRGLDEAGSRRGIDLIEAHRAIDMRLKRRRGRNRQLLGVVVIALVVAVALPVALRGGPQPAGPTRDGWAVVSKATAGLGDRTSFSTLASSGDSLLLGGALPNHRRPAIWYSDDGTAWKQAHVPRTTTPGEVYSIATTGGTALAIGIEGAGTGSENQFVWRSADDGRTWNVVAHDIRIFDPAATDNHAANVVALTHADGTWIASGFNAARHPALWASSDGKTWRQVLDALEPTSSLLHVVDNGDRRVFAYSQSGVWFSDNGTSWGPRAVVSLPSRPNFYLSTVAPGNSLAFGGTVAIHGGVPTPLLRRADGRQAWFVDPTFLAQFPDAGVENVTRVDGLFVATGTSGSPNHPDAWLSADGITWQSLPSSLYASSGGLLEFVGAVGNHIVLLRGSPETDQYYTLDVSMIADELALEGRQDAGDRYLCTLGINDADVSADGLPYFAGTATDRAKVERALQENRNRLFAENPEVVDITVGPGYRRAWKGVNGGPYEIVYVHDYALILHVKSDQDCPRGHKPLTFPSGVEVFYTAQ